MLRGVYDHVYAVKRIRLAKPKVSDRDAPDLFELRGFVPQGRKGQHVPSQSMAWKIRGVRGAGLIITLDGLPARCMVRLNNKPVDGYTGPSSCLFAHLVVPPARFRTGSNELRLDFVGPICETADCFGRLVLPMWSPFARRF